MELTLLFSIIFGSIGVILSILSIMLDQKASKEEKFKKIISLIPSIIKDVENNIGGGNGTLKKRISMSDIRMACIENGLKWNDKNEKLFDDYVESVLTTPQKKEQVPVVSTETPVEEKLIDEKGV